MENNNKIIFFKDGEISFSASLQYLLLKKFRIFTSTAILLICSIIYIQNLTPIYSSYAQLQLPSNGLIIELNKNDLLNQTKESILKHVLSLVQSTEYQKRIFIDNDYFDKLNPKNILIEDENDFIDGFINGIEIEQLLVEQKNKKIVNLIYPYYIVKLDGANPQIISEFINLLLVSAVKDTMLNLSENANQYNEITLKELIIERNSLIQLAKDKRLVEIAKLKENNITTIREVNLSIDIAMYREEQNRLYQINKLTDLAKIASALGIIENNFAMLNSNAGKKDLLSINLDNNRILPIWFLYGQKALIARISSFQDRENNAPYIKELIELQAKLEKAQTDNELMRLIERENDALYIDLSYINQQIELHESFNYNNLYLKSLAYTNSLIAKYALPSSAAIKPNKMLLLIVGLILSLIISILLSGINFPFKTNSHK